MIPKTSLDVFEEMKKIIVHVENDVSARNHIHGMFQMLADVRQKINLKTNNKIPSLTLRGERFREKGCSVCCGERFVPCSCLGGSIGSEQDNYNHQSLPQQDEM